jgi:phosphatidate cytidylyltransferase
MKSRLMVAAFGIPLVIVLLLLPAIAVTVMVSAISVLSVYELFHAVKAEKRLLACALCALSALGIQIAAMFQIKPPYIAGGMFLFLVILFALWVAYHERGTEFGFSHFGIALLSGLVIPFCLSSLIMLRIAENGVFLIFIPIGTAFIGDAGALFSGMVFGKHKLAPKTSPKKTVEGLLGAIVSSCAFMIVYRIVISAAFDMQADMIYMVLIGAVCGLLAQLGDLAFSLIKREFGIKDYGSLLPGHGGALDRFDSMITVAPAVFLISVLIRLF